MSFLETVGLAWVVFTSSIATVGILYLAFIGLKVMLPKDLREHLDLPIKVKQMFKIAR